MSDRYIENTVKEIQEKVLGGSLRIIVVMPVGAELIKVALGVIKALSEKSLGKIAYASLKMTVDWMGKQLAHNNCVECCTPRELENIRTDDFDFIILDYLRAEERYKLYEVFKGYEGTIISFCTPYQEIDNTKSELLENYRKECELPGTNAFAESIVIITAISLINIDDWMMASLREQRILRSQLYTIKERLKVSVEEQRTEEQLAAVEGKMQLVEAILQAIGISADLLDSANHEIEKLRKELEGQMFSDKESEREQAITILQEKTVSVINELTKGIIRLEDKQKSEEEIIGFLSDGVWKKLNSDSRNYLSTARITFNNMVKMDEADKLDYSGVCLLITKAVDVEVFRRFFKAYKKYLKEQYKDDYSKWPRCMLDKYGKQPIAEKMITLGSIIYLMGMDLDDKKSVVVDNESSEYKEFIRFASEKLFTDASQEEIEAMLYQDAVYIEEARNEYRNKTAHRNEMNQSKAKECNDYVIERIKIMRKILEPMRF